MNRIDKLVERLLAENGRVDMVGDGQAWDDFVEYLQRCFDVSSVDDQEELDAEAGGESTFTQILGMATRLITEPVEKVAACMEALDGAVDAAELIPLLSRLRARKAP